MDKIDEIVKIKTEGKWTGAFYDLGEEGIKEISKQVAKEIFKDIFNSSNNENGIRRCIKEDMIMSFDREMQTIKKKWLGD